MTSQSEVAEFFARLRESQHRLAKVTSDTSVDGAGGTQRGLAAEVAALGEELLVAEEELRVQGEELAAARLRLENLVARHEALVGPDGHADLVTDPQGIVVEASGAALQLFNRQHDSGSRTAFANWFAGPDRRRIRSLISRATVAGKPVSAQLSLPCAGPGGEQPFTVTAQLRAEPRTGSALLCWELTPLVGPPEEPDGTHRHLQLIRDEPALTSADREDVVRRVLSTARADLAAQLSADDTPDAWLARVLELALRWVPGAEQASISVSSGRDAPTTVHAIPTTAAAWDRAQAELRQGPMIDVLAGGAAIRVDDLATDSRWPDLLQRGAELDVRSMLVCPLPVVRHGAGTLSLYARQPGAFTPVSEIVLPVFASRASIALAYIDQIANLRRAIGSRQQIGQAVGILMERHKFTPEQAFERLVEASQHSHIKLRELAAQICETGQEPQDIKPNK